MNKDLAIRAASAFVFLFVTLGIYKIWDTPGLSVLTLVVVAIGVFEYSKMFFKGKIKIQFLFLIVSALSLPTYYVFGYPQILFSSLIIFSLGTFIIYRKLDDVHQILSLIHI